MTNASLSRTSKQMRYLLVLAERTGTTFMHPKTRAEACREIDRMIQLRRDEPRIYNRHE